MRRKHFILLYFPFLCLFLFSGCSQEPKRIPDTLPEVHGYIGSIKRSATKNSTAKAVIMVKAIEGLTGDYPDASIRIDEDTKIEDMNGKPLKPEQLREGHEIKAWLDGNKLESMPVQGYAKAIRVEHEL
ncbi:YobA family protein [Pontibacter sp. E15-1]|uniref:YobA family protein n=1 Tax=Pontibacter sp. E15-1 TaxID=2919918 RepID=UPI001F4F7CA0|nr:YobA family protein [Pontibacter sp. E15-1]MCJ8167250.1 YobA family protein [Pontibacter sp. E15-1]